MSSAHRAGERFIVYKLDYGCYADLVNTNKSTTGMLLEDVDEVYAEFDVPDDDARSYRRAVLDLSVFYADRRMRASIMSMWSQQQEAAP
jgi:hypothetical protein